MRKLLLSLLFVPICAFATWEDIDLVDLPTDDLLQLPPTDDYETKYNNLKGLYDSQVLYNESLETQMSDYLEANSWSIVAYNLIYENDGQYYSVPMSNDCYLPNWYRAVVDSGVVAIVPIYSEFTALYMDDQDFVDNVVANFGLVFVFFVSSGLFLLFLYTIRKYFIWLKS